MGNTAGTPVSVTPFTPSGGVSSIIPCDDVSIDDEDHVLPPLGTAMWQCHILPNLEQGVWNLMKFALTCKQARAITDDVPLWGHLLCRDWDHIHNSNPQWATICRGWAAKQSAKQKVSASVRLSADQRPNATFPPSPLQRNLSSGA